MLVWSEMFRLMKQVIASIYTRLVTETLDWTVTAGEMSGKLKDVF